MYCVVFLGKTNLYDYRYKSKLSYNKIIKRNNFIIYEILITKFLLWKGNLELMKQDRECAMFEKADVVMSFKYMFPICIILMYSRYYKIFSLSLFLLHLYGMYFLYHGHFNDVHNRFFGLIDGQLWRVILIVKNMNLTKNANINFAESQDVWK